jgi:hypothetical protein
MTATTVIISMGLISITSAIIEKVYNTLGKTRKAEIINKISMGLISVIAIGCVVKVIIEISKL